MPYWPAKVTHVLNAFSTFPSKGQDRLPAFSAKPPKPGRPLAFRAGTLLHLINTALFLQAGWTCLGIWRWDTPGLEATGPQHWPTRGRREQGEFSIEVHFSSPSNTKCTPLMLLLSYVSSCLLNWCWRNFSNFPRRWFQTTECAWGEGWGIWGGAETGGEDVSFNGGFTTL